MPGVTSANNSHWFYIKAAPKTDIIFFLFEQSNCQNESFLLLQETNTGRTPLMCAIEKLDITLVETFVNLIDNTKMRQLLKSESFDGKNVHSIIEEIKATFTMNDYKKLTDLLKFSTTNDDQLSIGSSGYDSIFSM